MTQEVKAAIEILKVLGLPKAQQNERSGLVLMALANLKPGQAWTEASTPLMGITPIMEFSAEHHGKKYKANTRESVRRFTMHQLVDAGVAYRNPDKPDRPVNSQDTVYQLTPPVLAIVRAYGSVGFQGLVDAYLKDNQALAARYARERDMQKVPVQIPNGGKLELSPGKHSDLIKAIIEEFASRYVPGAVLVYAGDTGKKWGYFDRELLATLGVQVDTHGKMPDVILYDPTRKWLLLVESVTSHGPVDGKRHEELAALFASSTSGLVYVTAFPSRKIMAKYLPAIAWETEVWCSDAPTHLIHFNGTRFLGPY